MTSEIHTYIAREHAGDLRRAAERSRRAASGAAEAPASSIELRPARADEAHVVARLAELDEAAELEGQVLLALVDGDPVAGLSLCDGRVVANPFVSTIEAVALLRLRAELVASTQVPRRRRMARRLAARAA